MVRLRADMDPRHFQSIALIAASERRVAGENLTGFQIFPFFEQDDPNNIGQRWKVFVSFF